MNNAHSGTEIYSNQGAVPWKLTSTPKRVPLSQKYPNVVGRKEFVVIGWNLYDDNWYAHIPKSGVISGSYEDVVEQLMGESITAPEKGNLIEGLHGLIPQTRSSYAAISNLKEVGSEPMDIPPEVWEQGPESCISGEQE